METKMIFETREKLTNIVKHNERMMEKGREDLVVTFLDESEGIAIWNPFFDASERFEVDPFEEYTPLELFGMIDNYKALRRRKWVHFLLN